MQLAKQGRDHCPGSSPGLQRGTEQGTEHSQEQTRNYPGFFGSLSRALPPFSFLTSFSLLRLREARSLLKEPLRFRDPEPSWKKRTQSTAAAAALPQAWPENISGMNYYSLTAINICLYCTHLPKHVIPYSYNLTKAKGFLPKCNNDF